MMQNVLGRCAAKEKYRGRSKRGRKWESERVLERKDTVEWPYYGEKEHNADKGLERGMLYLCKLSVFSGKLQCIEYGVQRIENVALDLGQIKSLITQRGEWKFRER